MENLNPFKEYLGSTILVRSTAFEKFTSSGDLREMTVRNVHTNDQEHFVLLLDASGGEKWHSADKLVNLGRVPRLFDEIIDTLRGSNSREITTHHSVNSCNNAVKIKTIDGEPGLAPKHYALYVRDAREYFYLRFQDGSPADEVNGITQEALIAICLDRLEAFQRGPFACKENADAIHHLIKASHHLLHRTRDRQARGVEGTRNV